MIGLLIIATGGYTNFLQRLIKSTDKYFLKNKNVTYFIFTDKDLDINSDRNIVCTKIKQRGFPAITLERYHTFYNNKELFNECEYLFYIDADSLMLNEIGEEILSDRVSVLHSHHYKNKGTPETNIKSTAYIDINVEDYNYIVGAFNGGTKDEFLKLSKVISDNVDIDKKNNIIALWNDESHLNRYFIDNKPTLVLDRNYMYSNDCLS